MAGLVDLLATGIFDMVRMPRRHATTGPATLLGGSLIQWIDRYRDVALFFDCWFYYARATISLPGCGAVRDGPSSGPWVS